MATHPHDHTMTTATEAYHAACEAGEGFDPGPWMNDRSATLNEAVEAQLEEDGAKLAFPREVHDEIVIVECGDGRYMAIGDEDGCAWACYL